MGGVYEKYVLNFFMRRQNYSRKICYLCKIEIIKIIHTERAQTISYTLDKIDDFSHNGKNIKMS